MCAYIFVVFVCMCVLQPLTFGSFEQVDLQDCLRRGLPPSNQQPHHRPRLLQSFHCPTMNHLRHIDVVHTQHTVVDPAPREIQTCIKLFLIDKSRRIQPELMK